MTGRNVLSATLVKVLVGVVAWAILGALGADQVLASLGAGMILVGMIVPWGRKRVRGGDTMRRMQDIYYRPEPPKSGGAGAQVVKDAVTPLIQALIAGVLVTWTVSMAVLVFSKALPPWPVIGLLMAGTTLGAWLAATWGLVWRIERATGLDINQDGTVGPPPDRRGVILVNAAPEHVSPPPDPNELLHKRMVEFAEAAAIGTGRRFLEKRGFTRAEIDELRALLIRCRFAAWDSTDNQSTTAGWHLTRTAAEIAARLL